ncbi:MAG: toxin glutamine deamidase domain-containing protein, partial [Dermatophilaceae bacterium]
GPQHIVAAFNYGGFVVWTDPQFGDLTDVPAVSDDVDMAYSVLDPANSWLDVTDGLVAVGPHGVEVTTADGAAMTDAVVEYLRTVSPEDRAAMYRDYRALDPGGHTQDLIGGWIEYRLGDSAAGGGRGSGNGGRAGAAGATATDRADAAVLGAGPTRGTAGPDLAPSRLRGSGSGPGAAYGRSESGSDSDSDPGDLDLDEFPPQSPNTRAAVEHALEALKAERDQIRSRVADLKVELGDLHEMTVQQFWESRLAPSGLALGGPARMATTDDRNTVEQRLVEEIATATTDLRSAQREFDTLPARKAAGRRARMYAPRVVTEEQLAGPWQQIRPPEVRDAVSISDEAASRLRRRVAGPDGIPLPHVSPENWVQVINPGGPSLDGDDTVRDGEAGTARRINCIDSVRSALDTWFGRPTVAGARPLPPGVDEDDGTMWDQKARAILDRVDRWMSSTTAGDQRFHEVAENLVQVGPGAAATVTYFRPDRVAGHVIMAVNDHGRVVWADPQIGVSYGWPPTVETRSIEYSMFSPTGMRLAVTAGQVQPGVPAGELGPVAMDIVGLGS